MLYFILGSFAVCIFVVFPNYLPNSISGDGNSLLFQSALITEKVLSSFDLDVRTKAFGYVICAIRSLLPGVTVNISKT